ncbi:hypothetical protein KKA95_00300 [Patescibacteria group bacterium]|nr:hypothetical protein [Patescibacteria group bacterium]
MLIQREQYREFEDERFIYIGEAPAPSASPEADEAVESTEAKPAELDLSKVNIDDEINTKNGKAEGLINKIGTQMRSVDGIDGLVQKLHGERDTHFKELETEYKQALVDEGLGDFEDTEQYKEITEKADNFIKNIKERFFKGGGEKVVHREKVEREADHHEAQTALKEAKGEENIKNARIGVVKEYLDNHIKDQEGERALTDENITSLARHIIESNPRIELESKSPDELNDALIDMVDDYLTDAIQDLMQEAPSFDESYEKIKGGETAHFKALLQSEESLWQNFGQNSETLDDVAEILATRFDVREDDGGNKYYIDLMDGNTIHPAEAMQGEVDIKTKLETIVNTDLNNKENRKKHLSDIETARRELDTALRSEIEKGETGVVRGGRVDELSDLRSGKHEALRTLLDMNEAIRTGINNMQTKVEAQNQVNVEKQQEAAREQLFQDSEAEANWYRSHFEGVEGYTLIDSSESAKYTDIVTLKGDSGISTFAHITLDCSETPVVRIEARGDGYGKTYEYTPAEFGRLDGAALKTLIEKPQEQLVENKEKLTDVNVRMIALDRVLQGDTKKREGGQVSLDLTSITPTDTDTNTLIEDGATVTVPINIGGNKVGEMQINLATYNMQDLDASPVALDSFERSAQTTLGAAAEKIKTTADTMQQEAKKAEANNAEINTQVGADLPQLQTISGLAIEQATFEGNLADSNAEILTMQISEEGDAGEILAKVYVKAGTPAAEGQTPQPRQYILRHENPAMGDQTFENIVALKAYVETSKDSLTPAPKPYSEPAPETSVELLAGREGARTNLLKVMVSQWPDKVPDAIKEAVTSEETGSMEALFTKMPRFETAINKFVNGLSDERLGELKAENAATSFRPTKEERATLMTSFAEAYGDSGLEVAEKGEMDTINGIQVTIGTETQPFGTVFGENVAHILSMNCVIKKEGDQIKIKNNGEEDSAFKVVTNPSVLKDYLPTDMQDGYKKILNGEGNIDEFRQLAEANKLTMEDAQKLMEMMSDPKKVDAFKKMGFFEFFATLGEIFSMLQEAMKTKDFTTLHDVLLDVQEGRKPGEGLAKAKESYVSTIEAEDNVNTLLSYYHNPSSDAANKVFMDNEGNRLPYRTSVKAVIRARFESILGVGIGVDGIEQLAGGNKTKITALEGERKLEITIEGNRVTMEEVTVGTDNKTVKKPIVENRQFNGLTKNTDSLVNTLDFASPTPEQINAEAAKKTAPASTESTEAVTQGPIKTGSVLESGRKFVREENGELIIQSLTDNDQIQHILNPNTVASAVIIKSGKRVPVQQGPVDGVETFFYMQKGKERRIRVNNNDKIVETTLK